MITEHVLKNLMTQMARVYNMVCGLNSHFVIDAGHNSCNTFF